MNADGGVTRRCKPMRFTPPSRNNEAYSVMGKYTFDLGGGFKDEGLPRSSPFFGGYVHMDIGNPDKTQTPTRADTRSVATRFL